MNLLPIVISLLLLMSALTYSQIATTLQRTAIRSEYANFIQGSLRLEQNQMQKAAYDKKHITGKNKDDPHSNAPGRKKINIGYFTADLSSALIRDQQLEVLYRLVNILYGHRTFFQEALLERPDAGEAVIQALIDKLKEKKAEGTFSAKTGSVDVLSTFELEDPFLSTLWQEMIREVQLPAGKGKKPEYEPNILHYLFLAGETHYPYRIWLAEEPLLEAIFINPQIVQEIVEQRTEAYRYLINIQKEARSAEIKTIGDRLSLEFRKLAPTDLPEGALDFTPSLSKPPQKRR